MKRHATTLFFLVLAIGLSIYVWLDRNKVTSNERRDRENDVFPAWRREDLSKIEIAHDNETIVLVRDPATDSWRLAAPRAERADHAAVERLATTLEFATRVRKVAANDPVGFQTPRARGSVTMGALSFKFVLGAASPRPEGSGYLAVDDGEPFVASKELTDALLADADAYRDRTVIPYLSTEMARFEVIAPGAGFVVQRRDARSFDVPFDGSRVLASRISLDKVWGALAEMRAEAFPKDADVDRLTAAPRLTIRIDPSDKTKPAGELVVGDECPGHPDDVVVLRKTPTRVAACAPKGAMDALAEITAPLLIDRRPFGFRHDEIEELKLESGPIVIELARRGNGFHERQPDDRELPQPEADAVGDLLAAIEKTDASAVKAGAGAPFTAVARAYVWADEIEEVVEIGALEGDSVVVRRVRDDARLTLTALEARRLVARKTTLRSLVMLGETRKVTGVHLRCGVDQDLVDSGGGLRLETPKGYETDGSITQLVDGLVRGKVNEWTADRDDGTFGITENGCRAVLAFEDGNTPVTVLLGKATTDGVFGRLENDPAVFVAPAAIESLVRRIYVSRSALRVAPESIANVVVKGKMATSTDQDRLKDAVGAFYADHAISLGTDLGGPTDLEISVTIADGGPPKKITCAGTHCSTPGVKAVFEVPAANLERLYPTSAAKTSAPGDAGVVDAR